MGKSVGTALQIGASDNKTNDKQPILSFSSGSFPARELLFHNLTTSCHVQGASTTLIYTQQLLTTDLTPIFGTSSS